MVGMLCLLNLAVDAANYRAFLGFSKSELTASSFRAAYKALLRIKPDRDQRFVSVSNDALQKAYSVSPTFSQLRPQLEGELGHNWQVPAFSALGVHEIGTPWFLWALRSTADAQEVHKSAASARRFYRNVAKEINRACDEGRIPSRVVVSSLLDPGALANLRHLPQSFPRIAALFLLQYHTMEGRDDAILTESQRALYDEMTGRGPAPDLRRNFGDLCRARKLHRQLPSFPGCRTIDSGIGRGLSNRLPLPTTSRERPAQRRAYSPGSRHLHEGVTFYLSRCDVVDRRL